MGDGYGRTISHHHKPLHAGYSVERHRITFECMMSGTRRDASAGLDPEGRERG